MITQINTDKNVSVHEEYGAQLEALLTEELSRFEEQVTRLKFIFPMKTEIKNRRMIRSACLKQD